MFRCIFRKGIVMEEECKRMAQQERREYFRVEDVLPLKVKRVRENTEFVRSRVFSGFFSGFGISCLCEDGPDESISPHLWKLLVDMNTKLGLILDKLYLDGEGLAKAESRQVSLSASGIRFPTREEFSVGDFVEVKMLIPVHPPAWIVVYGNVARLCGLAEGAFEVAVDFIEMDDEVRDVINYYTLKRQREMIRRQRGYD
jgi:c-di-GMP-binding flagellar brake protein YcgR